MTEDRLERYAREGVHGARLAVNLERARPFHVLPWEDRSDEQREQDRRAASAVAAMAVHDAKLEAAELRKFRLAVLAHRAAIVRGLVAGEHAQEWESQMKPFRAALAALGPLLGSGEEEASHG